MSTDFVGAGWAFPVATDATAPGADTGQRTARSGRGGQSARRPKVVRRTVSGSASSAASRSGGSAALTSVTA